MQDDFLCMCRFVAHVQDKVEHELEVCLFYNFMPHTSMLFNCMHKLSKIQKNIERDVLYVPISLFKSSFFFSFSHSQFLHPHFFPLMFFSQQCYITYFYISIYFCMFFFVFPMALSYIGAD